MIRSTDFEIPQIPPTITPITRLIVVAITEIRIELRAPNQTPSKSDFPLLSVPNQCSAFGLMKRALKSLTLLTSLKVKIRKYWIDETHQNNRNQNTEHDYC